VFILPQLWFCFCFPLIPSPSSLPLCSILFLMSRNQPGFHAAFPGCFFPHYLPPRLTPFTTISFPPSYSAIWEVDCFCQAPAFPCFSLAFTWAFPGYRLDPDVYLYLPSPPPPLFPILHGKRALSTSTDDPLGGLRSVCPPGTLSRACLLSEFFCFCYETLVGRFLTDPATLIAAGEHVGVDECECSLRAFLPLTLLEIPG